MKLLLLKITIEYDPVFQYIKNHYMILYEPVSTVLRTYLKSVENYLGVFAI